MALKRNRNVSAKRIPRRTKLNRERERKGDRDNKEMNIVVAKRGKKTRRDVDFNGHLSNYIFSYEIREQNHLTRIRKKMKHEKRIQLHNERAWKTPSAIGSYQ